MAYRKVDPCKLLFVLVEKLNVPLLFSLGMNLKVAFRILWPNSLLVPVEKLFLERFVAIFKTEVAQLLDLYPRKDRSFRKFLVFW